MILQDSRCLGFCVNHLTAHMHRVAILTDFSAFLSLMGDGGLMPIASLGPLLDMAAVAEVGGSFERANPGTLTMGFGYRMHPSAQCTPTHTSHTFSLAKSYLGLLLFFFDVWTIQL